MHGFQSSVVQRNHLQYALLQIIPHWQGYVYL